MSQVIDEKVVELKFNNQQFEKNVKDSMTTIDKLKQSLNFSGASKSFNQITEAANNVSFKGLEKSIDSASNYMSIKSAAIFTVVNNLVTKIQNSITDTIKQFTSIPRQTGFEEYELKMGSVQTIMAATGESLETVNKYLEELNKYSDKTIYSFSDMTQNIGKFTNAGVKLEDAVLAMKGISNEAAVSGANAQEASRAMYNLAQSLSMGYVQYIDWKSIENANMATVQFKENLANAAIQLGVITKGEGDMYHVGGKVYNLQQLFKDALKDQWLTTDVLINTLRDYADETTEIGGKAYAAAQDVKTFSMMMDTLKEAAQSGWAYTWEIVVGDFNEAKQLFTKFSQIFGEMIDKAADARNKLLKSVLGSKWDQLVEQINAAGISTEEFEGRLIRVLRDAGIPIDEMIDKWGSLGEAIKHIGNIKDYVIKVIKSFTEPVVGTAEAVGEVTKNLEDFQTVVNQVIRGEFGNGKARVEALTAAGWKYAEVQGLVNKIWERNGKTWKDTTITADDLVGVMTEMNDEELKQIGFTEEQIAAFRKLQEECDLTGTNLNMLLDNLHKKEGRELIFDSIRNAVTATIQVFDTLKAAWLEVFPKKPTEELYGIIEAIYKFSESLVMNDEQLENLKNTFKGLFSILGIIIDIIQAFLNVIMPKAEDKTKKANDGILSFTANIGKAITNFRAFMNEHHGWVDVIRAIGEFFSYATYKIGEFINKILEIPMVQNIIVSVLDKLKSFAAFIKEIFNGMYTDLTQNHTSLKDTLIKAITKIQNKLKGITKLVPGLEKAFNFFVGIPKMFKANGKNVVAGFLQGLAEGIKQIPKKIVEFATLIVDKFKDFLGIQSPSKVFMELAMYCVQGFSSGFINNVGIVIDALKNFITKIADFLKEKFKSGETFFNASDYLSYMKPIIDTIAPMLTKLKDILVSWLKEVDVDKLLKYAIEILVIFYIIKKIKTLAETAANISSAAKSLADSFHLIGTGLHDFFESMAFKRNISTIVKNLTFSILLIVGVIVAVAKYLKPEEINSAWSVLGIVNDLIFVMGTILAALLIVGAIVPMRAAETVNSLAKVFLSIGIMLALVAMSAAYLATVAQDISANGATYRSIGSGLNIIKEIMETLFLFVAGLSFINIFANGNNTLVGVALTIAAMTAAIYIIMEIIKKTFYKDDGDGAVYFDEMKLYEIRTCLKVLYGIIAAMTIALVAISIASKAGVTLVGVGAAVTAMAFSLYIIIGAIALMDLAWSSLKHPVATMISIVGFLIVFGIIIGLLSDMVRVDVGTGITQVALLALSFSAALYIISMAIKNLDGVNADKRILSKFDSLASTLTTMLILVVICESFKRQDIIGANNSLYAVSVLLLSLAGTLWIITRIIKDNDMDTLSEAVFIMATIVGAMGLLMAITTEMKGTWQDVGVIAAIAASIVMLAGGILLLKDMNTDDAVALIISLAGALAGLIYVSSLLKGDLTIVGIILSVGAAVLMLAAAVWILEDALNRLQSVDANKLAEPLTVMAGVLLFLLGVLVALFVVFKAIGVEGVAYVLLAALVVLALAASAWLLADAISTVAESSDKIKEIFNDVGKAIEGVINWVKELINWFNQLLEKYEGIKQFLAIVGSASKSAAASVVGPWGGILVNTNSVAKSNAMLNEDIKNSGSLGAWIANKFFKSNKKSQQEAEEMATKTKTRAVKSEMGYGNGPKYEIQKKTQSPKAGAIVAQKAKESGILDKNDQKTFAKNMTDSMEKAVGDPSMFDMSGVADRMQESMASSMQGFDYNEISQQFLGSFNESLNLESFGQMTGMDFSQANLSGMMDGFMNGELSFDSMKDMFNVNFGSEEMQSMFSGFGMDLNDSMWNGFMTMDGINSQKAIQSGAVQTMAWDSKLGTVVPVYSAQQNTSYAKSGYDMSSLFSMANSAGFGQTTVEFPDTMQTTSPDIVSAVNGLKQDIATLGNRIANLYVRLDTGTLVGELTPSINQAMGRMAVNSARGN